MLKHIALFSAFGLALLSAGCPKGAGTGTLAINISGISGDAVANVQLTGGQGFDEVVSASSTLTVPAGIYTVKGANAVSSDLTTYTAVVTGSPATVSDGATTTVTVVYSASVPAMGALAINISGISGDAVPNVQITGGQGFDEVISASSTLTVPAGVYNVVGADAVSSDATSYTAVVTGSPATVSDGATTTVTVVYSIAAQTNGTLQINVSGLPNGAPASLVTSGPSGFDDTGTVTHVVPPGTYSVAAANVTSGSGIYAATVTGSPATVTAGQTATVSVVYANIAGALQINVSGLPSGALASLVTSGPYGFDDTGTATHVVPPGTYTVTAMNVTSGSATYAPTISGSPVSVISGSTSTVTVVYAIAAPTTGTLQLNISGLPAGTLASVTATNGTTTITESATATVTLSPGTYTVTATNVTSGSATYAPTVSGSPVTIVAGSTSTVTVVYAVIGATGTLQVNLTGGEPGTVTISGPNGYSSTTTATETLPGLVPGSYTVAGANIVDGGFTYGATVTGSPAAVTSGATTTVAVAYAQLNGTANVIVTFPGGIGTGQTYFTNVYLLRGGSGSPVTGYNTSKVVPVATYTITANPVTISNVVYTATVTTSPFNVTANATSTVTVDYEFAPPTITSVAQSYALNGQYTIGIQGTGFASDGHTVANIDGVPCTGVTIQQETMNREALSCTVPTPHAAGFVNVTVTTTEGTTAVSPAFQYEYWSVDYYPLVGVDDLATTGGMTLGPDNNIWFVDRTLGYVGTVTSTGTLIECALPTFLSGSTTDPAEPSDIATGTDGNLWIADYGADVIYSMSPTGFAADSCPVTEYEIKIPAFHPPNTMGGHPWAITSGPDGNIWFTLQATVNGTFDQIGTIQVASSTTTAYGKITEFALAASGSGVWGITTGPDGRLWFGYDSVSIGTITTDGGTIGFNSDNGGGYFLTTGPDGNIWYLGGSYLGMMTPNGVATAEPGAGVGSPQAVHIASDPRGAVWFGGNQLQRYDTALLTDRSYPVSAKAGIVVAPDGTIWSICVEPSGPGLTPGLNAICRLHV